MQTPSSAELLDAWDSASQLGESARAVSLLLSGRPDDAPDQAASLSIGERDRQLVELRERLFGHSLTGLITCPVCGQRLEVEILTDDLHSSNANVVDGTASLTLGEWTVHYRQPNSLDTRSIEGQREASVARRMLLQRCLVEIKQNGVEVSAAELPDELGGAIGQQMAAVAPVTLSEIPVDCPDCGRSWTVPFDIARFLWAEVDAWARRLLRQVHEIATAYGWSEADILRISPTRRSRYQELIAG